jgi:hypothetical protein
MQYFRHTRILTRAAVLIGLLLCLAVTLLIYSPQLPAVAVKGHHRHARSSPTSPTSPTTSLTIQFTCAQAVDYQSGEVCVHTQAGAALSIIVTYCSGYTAVSSSLQGIAYADTSGNYTWTWTPETVCRGPATADVTASSAGQTVSQSDSFTVQ